MFGVGCASIDSDEWFYGVLPLECLVVFEGTGIYSEE